MSEQTVVEDIAHSRLGASGAYRWMNCAGSVSLIRKVHDEETREAKTDHEDFVDESGAPAAEGNAAHHVCAECLTKGKDAWEYIGQELVVNGMTFTVDDEMAEGVQMYVDLVRKKLEQHDGAKMYVETPLSTMLADDMFGTPDVQVFVVGERIILVDFKYGRIPVEPDCVQLKYYGYMSAENMEVSGDEIVELWIVQPRASHSKGPVRKHITNVSELTKWFTGEALPAAERARQANADFTIGRWCDYCPAKKSCPAFQADVEAIDTTLDPVHMSNEELGAWLNKKKAVLKFFADMDMLAYRRAMKGEGIPGWKLVGKRTTRVWRTNIVEEQENGSKVEVKLEDALISEFGDEAYKPREFRTAPDVEKSLKGGKKFVSRWAYKPPSSGLTLVEESDTRDAVKGEAILAFSGSDDAQDIG